MQELGWGWELDGRKVLFRGRPVRGVDASTFRALTRGWAHDAKKVYSFGRVIRAADQATLQMVDRLFAKDAGHVFFDGEILPDANPVTFRAVGSDCQRCQVGGYGTDGVHVYYVEPLTAIRVLARPDARTFEALGNGFARDNRTVYYRGYKLPGAVPKSWEIISGTYSRSDKHVFSGNQRIAGADRRTFQPLPGDQGWSVDDSQFYEGLRSGDRDRYFDDFERYFIFRGRIEAMSEGTVEEDHPCCRQRELTIRCLEWLRRPLLEVASTPEPGQSIVVTADCDGQTPLEGDQLFVLRAGRVTTVGEPPGLVLTRHWEQFSSLEHLPLFRSLISELEGTVAPRVLVPTAASSVSDGGQSRLSKAIEGLSRSEEWPFLKAIVEVPHSDEPRLVYADWLEERGDPRGEFIRVQCAKAQARSGSPEWQALNDREIELRRKWRRIWAEPYFNLGVNELQFDRGMPSELELTGEAFFAELNALSDLPVVSYRVLCGRNWLLCDLRCSRFGLPHREISPAQLVELLTRPRMPALETLVLNGGPPTLKTGPVGHPAFQTLSLTWPQLVDVFDLLEELSLSQVTALELSRKPADDACVEPICQSRHLRGLRRLQLIDPALSGQALQRLRETFGDRLAVE